MTLPSLPPLGDTDWYDYATDLHAYVGGIGSPPAASETTAGLVELATTAEATTGTDTVRAVTPAGVKAVADTKSGTGHTHDYAASVVAANLQTGASYTLVLGDSGMAVEMSNAGANTLTIPANATVAFPIGTVVEVFQVGAGQTTVAAAGGVTLRAPDGAKLAKQYASASLRKRGTDEWVLAGNTTT